ncbi:MAG: hypothetical protein LBT54_03260, partial [Bifidobacteriaceae bacterium]|nr:hypothetical protein [Bifidobacteriaceae bacterium]
TQVDQPSGNSHNPDWLIDPAPLLSRLLQADLAKATQRAQLATRTHGRVPAHHDILAQLSFGAWRFLLPNANPGRQYLWNHALTRAFPHLARPVNDFVADIDSLYRLRNRVAHLESVLDIRFANRHFRAMRRVLGEVDPRVEEWFTSQQRITTVLKNRPTT